MDVRRRFVEPRPQSPNSFGECPGILRRYGELGELRKNARIVTTPEELEALEREILELTDRMASLVLEQKLQASLDEAELEQGEKNW